MIGLLNSRVEELKTLANEWQNTFNAVGDAIWLLDVDLRIIRANKATASIFGKEPSEVEGLFCHDVVHGTSSLYPACPTVRMRETLKRESMELCMGERWFEIVVDPILDGNGRLAGMVHIVSDITEKTRIQELIIQTEKMMSLGGMAAGMAHEINNPLGIINLAVQNIERRIQPTLPANQKAAAEIGVDLERLHAYFAKRDINQFVQTIKAASSRAARIVSNMLQFTRKGNSIRQAVLLPDVLGRVVEFAAHDYDLRKKYDFRSVEIVREYEVGVPPVQAVVVEIEQVFLNLVKNAAQAMGANPPERKARLTLRVRRDGNYAVVEVEDNGPGMTAEIRRRVFEPFFTTKEPGVGTGLGLSVSYMIITQNHKGVISVQSSPGGGALFIVRLPLTHTEKPS